MIRRFLFPLLLAITLSRAAEAPENRIWKTVRGQIIEGSLQSSEGDSVVIQRKNSKQTVKVPKEELMPVDAMYVEQAEKKNSAPPASAPSSKACQCPFSGFSWREEPPSAAAFSAFHPSHFRRQSSSRSHASAPLLNCEGKASSLSAQTGRVDGSESRIDHTQMRPLLTLRKP